MKTYSHFSKVILLGLFATLFPHTAKAMFPTFDAAAVTTSIETNVNAVKQIEEIQSVKDMSQKINSSIGSATSSISKLKSDSIGQIQEKADKIKKEKERIEEKKKKIDDVKKEIEKKKKQVAEMKAQYEDYRAQANEIKAEVNDFKDQINEAKDTVNEVKSMGSDVSGLAKTGLGAATSTVGSTFGVTKEIETVKSAVAKETSSAKAAKPIISSSEKSYSEPEEEVSEEVETSAVVEDVEEVQEDSDGEIDVTEEVDIEESLSAEEVVDTTIQSQPVKKEIEQNSIVNDKVLNTTPRGKRKPFGLFNKSEKVKTIQDEAVALDKVSYKFSENMVFAQLGQEVVVHDNFIDGKFALSEKLVDRCKKDAKDLANIDELKKCIGGLVLCMNDSNIGTAKACQAEYREIMSDQTLNTLARALEMVNKTAGFEKTVVEKNAKVASSAEDERAEIATGMGTINTETMKVFNNSTDMLAIQNILKSMSGIGDIKPEHLDLETTEDSGQ